MADFWYSIVAEYVNPDDAFKWEIEMWARWLYPYIQPRLNRTMNIQGDDVATVFKTLQIMPDGGEDIYVMDWYLENKDHGILTLQVCRPLLFLENEGKGRKAILCPQMELACFSMVAEFVNPDIKVMALKIPPRKSKDEIACQWEFKL
ncbi:hypothetical protein ACFLX5_06155 [Chloroflexota bacterium]